MANRKQNEENADNADNAQPQEAEQKEQPEALAEDAGQAEVAEKMEAEQEKGYVGIKVDPTPNENYTVAGVLAGLPTPENDHDLRQQALKRADDLAHDRLPEDLDN